jgi:hypothetical protein
MITGDQDQQKETTYLFVKLFSPFNSKCNMDIKIKKTIYISFSPGSSSIVLSSPLLELLLPLPSLHLLLNRTPKKSPFLSSVFSWQ